MKVQDLPDFAAIAKLSAALWHKDNGYHGAAVMVGAGFSRCAARSGDLRKRLPLWSDLSQVLAKELGTSAAADPLRLAEEYRAYFGQQAIYDLIRVKVDDLSWVPQVLYRDLLQLPWSDVLTTNWDTLLERASIGIGDRPYAPVLTQDDLSSARAPRIIKLHGTLNVTNFLTFTQEDYRQYPTRYAAFVNVVRQVLIENELCLLGFSGDDPNFLQWAGWVRDQLVSRSRRIYLVGSLKLTAAKRRYFESINIAPIDLYEAVSQFDEADDLHREAVRLFLQTVRELKPANEWDWRPSERTALIATAKGGKDDKSKQADALERRLPALQAERQSYPGWLVCPVRPRFEVQMRHPETYPGLATIQALEADSRALVLHELAWRHSVTFEPIPGWLFTEMLSVVDLQATSHLSKRARLEVSAILLASSRWADSDLIGDSVAKLIRTLEGNAETRPEGINDVTYYKALVARDSLDYNTLAAAVEAIHPTDPVWKLRKAALLEELGEHDTAQELISTAYKELSALWATDRNSTYVLSRLAWAHWLMRHVAIEQSVARSPAVYRERNCDPASQIEHIQERISKELERKQEELAIRPSFEPGRYRPASSNVSFSSEVNPIALLDAISTVVGIPLRWKNVEIIGHIVEKAVKLKGIEKRRLFSLAIRCATHAGSPSLKRAFSRLDVAQLSDEDCEFLRTACIASVKYWAERVSSEYASGQSFSRRRLDVFIEVLARISVRSSPNEAKSTLKMILGLVRDRAIVSHTVGEPLGHLIEYALGSIPKGDHHELLPEALQFPMAAEVGAADHWRWPNIAIDTPGVREANSDADRRIGMLIESVGASSKDRTDAILRLLPLWKAKYLSQKEVEDLADKIWGIEPKYESLPKSNLLMQVFLELPSRNEESVLALVKKSLFEVDAEQLFKPYRLISITQAAIKCGVTPNPDQAQKFFDLLTVWRPTGQGGRDPFGLLAVEEREIARAIGDALSRSIVPALPSDEITEKRLNELLAFSDAAGIWESIVAVGHFAIRDFGMAAIAMRKVTAGLQNANADAVAYASFAVLHWRQLSDAPIAQEMVRRLSSLLCSGHMAGRPAMLWVANELVRTNLAGEDNLDTMANAVPSLFESAEYADIPNDSADAASASLLRAACVRLGKSLIDLRCMNTDDIERILDRGAHDPLPEVRFALAG